MPMFFSNNHRLPVAVVTPALVLALAGMLGCRAHLGTAAGKTPSPALPLVISEPSAPEAKFEGDFLARLHEASDSETFRALVDLTEQIDLSRWTDALRSDGRSKAERRSAVIAALESVSARQQARLRPQLDRLISEGSIDHVRSVAIVNRLLIEGRAGGILALATSPEVARILPEWTSRRGRGQSDPRPGSPAEERFESWAVSAMGIEEFWKRGLDGSGVVVATIDTGAYAEHEQFRGRAVEGERGWFDPVEGRPAPYDSHGHGTSVLSVAVGSNPDGKVIGMAPGARWAAAIGNWKNFYSRWRMTEAADWVLRVAQPDVLINAWSNDRTECSDFDLPFINAWKAAEIFVVFPAGNAGPDPATGEAPASLTGTVPDGRPVFSVAALAPGGEVHELSSRGPSRCGSTAFPSIAAPGDQLPHATLGRPTAYAVGHGTSLAAGIVGGVAALILQADPSLGPDEVEALLEDTARKLTTTPDPNATGAGGVDLRAVLERLGRASSTSSTPPRGETGP